MPLGALVVYDDFEILEVAPLSSVHACILR